ncbi:MAG TPA: CBS domain-containing protein [Denitromonas sp.]|uniref:CBS domain-containing protein n=1 Tax=Denitromonas sp. TaxID=2734609 RepID=UPI001D7DFBC2|nr:CBS domain-containing protein [Rhodocyclaceae bacterium]MCP5222625.1 CBS domain-containing protein [Zoogloeaceae bacterium]HPR06090.1 CBS domain-containing protein [Denitromonas sp.]HQU88881.1 CBS domain-containing protein [Denitromonas sp.]HQV14903.1 CBS domain-containing protein [Denitromonas sp.]
MHARPLHQVMHAHGFLVVAPDTPVLEVVCQMAQARLSAALIAEHGVLTGIFTEQDATFRVLGAGLDAKATPVSDAMTHNPVTSTPHHPFGHALHMMYEGGFRHLPIVDANRKPVGMVSSKDALNLEAIELQKELVRREEITVIL